MGFAMVTMDAPVTKTSSSILLFKEDVVAKSLETACINCGRCVEICPSRIIPSRLADFSKRKDEGIFCCMEWIGMCGMWFLQLCLSGETSAETGNWFNA